jgi:integrase
VSVAIPDSNGKRKWEQVAVWAFGNADKIRTDCLARHAAAAKAVGTDNSHALTLTQTMLRYYSLRIGKKRRRANEWLRCIERYVEPSPWDNRPFLSLRRRDDSDLIAALRSPPRVKKDENGKPKPPPPWQEWSIAPVDMRAAVFSKLHTVTRWWEQCVDDQYMSPLNANMSPFKDSPGRETVAARARKRHLSDNEIVAVWMATDRPSSIFCSVVRMMLLVGLREAKVAAMRFSDIRGNKWFVPREEGEKNVPDHVALPKLALDIIAARRAANGTSQWVFPGRGDGHYDGWSRPKRRLDERTTISEPWCLHALRHTVVTHMKALKVPPHIAELAVGHTLTTKVSAVEDIYTHYTFDAERASAFETWNNHIQSLLARAKEVQKAA